MVVERGGEAGQERGVVAAMELSLRRGCLVKDGPGLVHPIELGNPAAEVVERRRQVGQVAHGVRRCQPTPDNRGVLDGNKRIGEVAGLNTEEAG